MLALNLAVQAQVDSSKTNIAALNKKSEQGTDEKEKITDRRHPDYIRCRKEPIIGSLARKRKICLTNREWESHTREGNKRSKEFVQESTTGFRAGD